MIIATLVLYLQVRYINTKDLGFNKDMLVVVDVNSGKVRNSASVIAAEFSKIPDVQIRFYFIQGARRMENDTNHQTEK